MTARLTRRSQIGARLAGSSSMDSRRAVDRRHPLALGVERHLGDAREGRVEVVLPDAGVGRGHDQRAFGRVADRVVAAAVASRPATATASLHSAPAISSRSRVGCAPGVATLPVGTSSNAVLIRRLRQVERVVGDVERRHRHAVLRQRAGLVRADDGDRAERLDGRQLADQRLALEHALRAQRERDGDHRGQRLGHGGHRQADGRQQQLLDVALRRGSARGRRSRDQDQRRAGQPLAQLVQALLQRRLLLLPPTGSWSAMWPSSVCMPVSVTTNSPRP